MDHNHRPGRVTAAVESRALGTHFVAYFLQGRLTTHIDYINCANKSAYVEKVVIIRCCVVVVFFDKSSKNKR